MWKSSQALTNRDLLITDKPRIINFKCL